VRQVTYDYFERVDIRTGKIIKVEDFVKAREPAYDSVGKPFEIRENPQVDAQFRIPYTVSVATARRKVFINDFFEQKVRADNQVLQKLAKKVKVVVDQAPIAKGLTSCIVDIKTKDRKVYSERVGILVGETRKP